MSGSSEILMLAGAIFALVAAVRAERQNASLRAAFRQPARTRRAARLCLLGALASGWFAAGPESRPFEDSRIPIEETVWLCVDVSRSMTARDSSSDAVSPLSRLERVQSDLTDWLEGACGVRVGLVAFAGSAATLCPPTSDLATVRERAARLTVFANVDPGSRLQAGLKECARWMEDEDVSRRRIVVFGDGELDDEPAALAGFVRSLATNASILDTVCYGTEQGAALEPWVSDEPLGSPSEASHADPPVLARLAEIGRGEAVREFSRSAVARRVPRVLGSADARWGKRLCLLIASLCWLVIGPRQGGGR